MRVTSVDLLDFERRFLDEGKVVVGIDEVGRGALAGPMFVGAVVLSSLRQPPVGLNDSKLLSPARRNDLEAPLRSWADDWALGAASAKEIDTWGVRMALAVAATRALDALSLKPTHALIDGPLNLLSVPDPAPMSESDRVTFSYAALDYTTIVKGDQRSATIAGASVLAKVSRDRWMTSLADDFPEYGWHDNKGYGAPHHLAALRRIGPSVEHRTSWRLPGPHDPNPM